MFRPQGATLWGKASLDSSTETENTLNNGALEGNKTITTVILPPSLRIIGDNSISGCSVLTSISIPASVTSIGESTFADCTTMTNITLNSATLIPYSTDMLSVTSVLKNIYVPTAIVETYKAAIGWGAFAAKITAIP